jgi:hypothetical protein
VGRSATTNKQYFILGPINFHQSGNFNQWNSSNWQIWKTLLTGLFFVYLLFYVPFKNFHLYEDVAITNAGVLEPLRLFSCIGKLRNIWLRVWLLKLLAGRSKSSQKHHTIRLWMWWPSSGRRLICSTVGEVFFSMGNVSIWSNTSTSLKRKHIITWHKEQICFELSLNNLYTVRYMDFRGHIKYMFLAVKFKLGSLLLQELEHYLQE